MAHYLITGGCGFIGSHLAESLLRDGHKVRILDDLSTGKLENISDECEVVIGDVVDSHAVRTCMRNVDGCFHLAAIASVQESNENWAKTHKINLTGSINIFDAAREKKTPVVYASSAAVYGDNAEMPLRETSRGETVAFPIVSMSLATVSSPSPITMESAERSSKVFSCYFNNQHH